MGFWECFVIVIVLITTEPRRAGRPKCQNSAQTKHREVTQPMDSAALCSVWLGLVLSRLQNNFDKIIYLNFEIVINSVSNELLMKARKNGQNDQDIGIETIGKKTAPKLGIRKVNFKSPKLLTSHKSKFDS